MLTPFVRNQKMRDAKAMGGKIVNGALEADDALGIWMADFAGSLDLACGNGVTSRRGDGLC